MMWYGWHDGGWDWLGWLTMGLMMVAFWGLLVGVVVAIFRSSGRGHGHEAPPAEKPKDEALTILDGRFARGEIDADEYRSRRDLLRSA